MTLTKTDLANIAKSFGIRMRKGEECTVALLENRIKDAIKDAGIVSHSKCVHETRKSRPKYDSKPQHEVSHHPPLKSHILPLIYGRKRSKTGYKFWSITVEDRFVEIIWGREGTVGQSKKRDYKNVIKASDNARERIYEKAQNGYMFDRGDYRRLGDFLRKHHV